MSSDVLDWLMRSALALTLALAVLLPLRPVWRRALGAGSVLWLWLLLPAALVATSLPRPTAPTPAAAIASPGRATAAADGAALVAAPGTLLVDGGLPEGGTPATGAADADPAAGASRQGAAAVPGGTLRDAFAAVREWPAAWLLPLWLVGALALAARLVAQQRAFLRALGPLRQRPDGTWLASSAAIHPAVVGVLQPRVVLPADFATRFDARQQHLVLAHERVHLRRGDLQANLGMCVLRCIFWFNPLVHVGASRLRLDQELACDAIVLRENPGGTRAYATALLNTQLAVPGLPVGCAWQSSHPLKWRIAMLKHPSPGFARLTLGAGLALVASSATAMSLWHVQPVNSLRPVAAMAPARAPMALPPMAPVVVDAVPVAAVAPAVVVTPLPVAAPAAVVTAPVPAAPPSPPAPVAFAPAAVSPALAVPAAVEAPAAPEPPPALQPARVIESRLAKPPMYSHDRQYGREADARVLVQIELGADGRPVESRVVHSEMGKYYDRAALRAIRHWTFEPTRRDGVAIPSTIVVPVAFDVSRSSLDEARGMVMRHAPRPQLPLRGLPPSRD